MEKKTKDINLDYLSKEEKDKLVNEVLNEYQAFKAIYEEYLDEKKRNEILKGKHLYNNNKN